MADQQTPYYNLIKPEIGGSLDTWGEKWNANCDLLDAALNDKLDIDGTRPATGQPDFSAGGIKIGNYTLTTVGDPGVLTITHTTNGVLATLNEDGVLTAKDLVADPTP